MAFLTPPREQSVCVYLFKDTLTPTTIWFIFMYVGQMPEQRVCLRALRVLLLPRDKPTPGVCFPSAVPRLLYADAFRPRWYFGTSHGSFQTGGVFLMAVLRRLIRVHVPLDVERPVQLPPPSRRAETMEDQHVKTTVCARGSAHCLGRRAGLQSRTGGGGAEVTNPNFIPTSRLEIEFEFYQLLHLYSLVGFWFNQILFYKLFVLVR